MTLGIMQPYFMPYLGYFALIKHVDQFILFDTPQFIRHGWIERNQILKQNGEVLYIKVPLEKFSRSTPINKVHIKNNENWKSKIRAQLVPYKKNAPYYLETLSVLDQALNIETNSITELNFFSLKRICNYLDITTPLKIWSDMHIQLDKVEAPDEWALNICKAIGANAYYNPPGGKSFFNKDKYTQAGIDLKFLNVNHVSYNQFQNDFVPYLSIIDIMMFNNKEKIKSMINEVNFE